ncbi:hypothetical protein [Brevundimonas poindexterae]|uniref:hypothetical protein n=1 Tax=Brevundimonas poindexterae TaxID=74325 RepID=UPI001CFDD8E7|nr:hypothetical protein [Brevundimonas poindexterae]
MADTRKRKPVMDAIFGAPLTGDELARHMAARPPKWVYYAKQTTRLVIVVVLIAAALDREDQLPLIGPWLGQSGWGVYLIWGGGLAILGLSEWYFERRARALRRAEP